MDDILYKLKKAAKEYERNDCWDEEGVIPINSKIIELDKKDIDSYIRLIKCYLKKTDLSKVLELCNKVQLLDPNNVFVAKTFEIPELKQLKVQEDKHVLEADQRQRLDDNNFKFISLVTAALEDPLPVITELPYCQPSPQDRKLASKWMEKQRQDKFVDKNLLLNARMAEVAMAKFYRSQGKSVVDISITQIDDKNNSDWKKYDLLVDGVQKIDVKNATWFESKTGKYRKHCIPRFKMDRDLNQIEIAGVLSNLHPQEGDNSLFLGTTTKQHHDLLISKFSGTHLKINFQENEYSPKMFLPPWIYSYPLDMYQSRDNSLKNLQNLSSPNWEICVNEKINPLPAYIAAGIQSSLNPTTPLSVVQLEFITNLRLRISQMGLSLAVVFLSVLEHFISLLSSTSTEIFNPRDYHDYIFPKIDDTTRPLFLYDPLSTVDRLIKCLRLLWNNRRVSNLKEFKTFELQGSDIFCGKKNINELKWTTLLAYCGSGKCRKFPLLFGVQPTCSCGHLICECGYCSSKCSLSRTRQIEN